MSAPSPGFLSLVPQALEYGYKILDKTNPRSSMASVNGITLRPSKAEMAENKPIGEKIGEMFKGLQLPKPPTTP